MRFLFILLFFTFSNSLIAMTINEVKICNENKYKNKTCTSVIDNNSRININKIKIIFVTLSINNSSLEDKILTVRYIVNPSNKKNNFIIKDTIYENKITKPLPKSKRSKIKMIKDDVYVTDVRLLIENSPRYRTFSTNKVDKYIDIGEWVIEIIDDKDGILYSLNFELIQ